MTAPLDQPRPDLTPEEQEIRVKVRRLMAGAAFAETTDHPWHELEQGRITLQAFIDWVEGHVPGGGRRFDPANGPITVARLPMRDALIDEVGRLRGAGIATALVTNNVAEWRHVWSARLDLDALFDVVVDSSEVGMRKPDARIYEHTLSALGVSDPARSVFLDDMAVNVAGAEAVGLRGVVVGHDTDAVITRLRALTAHEVPDEVPGT